VRVTPWGVAASAVGSVVSGLIGSSDVSSAASSANATSQATINQAQTNYAPYTSAGSTANTQLANLSGINGNDAATSAMSTFQSSPGYAYTVQQGLRSVDAGAASQGMARSGSTIKAEETLGTNLADQNYNTYVNQLSSLSNTGLSATNGYENVANGQSTNQQNTTTSAGSNQASIAGNTTSGLTNSAGLYYKNSLSNGSAYGNNGTTTAFDGAPTTASDWSF
jgi:hypothetical protein